MELFTTADGWQFLFRWIHFLAGITWIGVLYYFNFIQTPFFGTDLGGQARGFVTRGLVPNALWWFRWGAMFTFISGWLIIFMRLHQGVALTDGYMTRILTGGIMGSFMWFNVWFVIWPIQQKVIASANAVAGGGEADPEAAALAPKAANASRTNTLFSIPMLFFMASASHLVSFNNGTNDMMYWIAAAILILLVEVNGISAPGKGSQKMLASVSGTIHAGVILTVLLYLAGTFLNG